MSGWAEIGKAVGGPLLTGIGSVVGGFAIKFLWDHSDKINALKEKIPGWSTTDFYTYSLVEAARKGAFPKAFGRDVELNALKAKVAGGYGIIFLLGASGVGKSTIVYELARQIAFGEVNDYLKDAQILALNLRKLFPKGVGDSLKTFFSGGAAAVVEKIIKDLEHRHLKGKITFLFIDECQDLLLKGNEKIFDDLKAELATHGIHIIAASMNQQDIEFWIQKEMGRERRADVIRVEPLTEKATVEVLSLSRPSLSEEFGKKFHCTVPTIDDSAIKATVFFAEKLYPKIVEPNRSTKFFREVIPYFCDKKKSQTSCGDEDVIECVRGMFASRVADPAIYEYKKHLFEIERRKKNHESEEKKKQFKESCGTAYFPPISHPCTPVAEQIRAEANILKQRLHTETSFPIAYECGSKEYGKEIVYLAMEPETEASDPVYHRCSITELRKFHRQYFKSKDGFDVEAFIREKLQSLDTGVLFIEEADELLCHLQDKQQQRSPSTSHNFSSTPIGQMATQGINQLNQLSQTFMGTVMIPHSTTLTKAAPSKPNLHPVDAIFCEFIENNRLKTVLLKTYYKPTPEVLTPTKVKLSPESTIQWLVTKLPKEMESSEKTAIATKIHSLVITMSLADSPNPSDTCHGLLNAIQMKSGGFNVDENWTAAIQEIAPHLQPSNTKAEYDRLKNKDTKQINTPAPLTITTQRPEQKAKMPTFTYLRHHFPQPLHNLLGELAMERDNSIPLLIGEDCPTTLMFRKSQVASWLAFYKRNVEFGFDQLSPNRDRDTVLLLDAEQIPSCIEPLKQFMQSTENKQLGIKVIIFGKTSLLPNTFKQGDVFDNVSRLVDSGAKLVGQFTNSGPSSGMTAQPQPWPNAKVYRSEPLTLEEKRLFLQFQIDSAKPKESSLNETNRDALITSYTYLWDRLNRNANGIAEDVRSDIGALSEKISNLDLNQIAEFFSSISKQFGMHPLEIPYLLTPELTPWSYYIWRKVTDPLLYVGNLVLWSVRSLMNYATGQIVGWITGLPIWKFASVFKRLLGWG